MAGFDSYVVALLHGEGTDNESVFTDETGRIWSTPVQAVTDTAQYKFGSSSIYINNGDDNWVATADSADFYMAAGDATIDCWFRLEYTPNDDEISNIWSQVDSGDQEDYVQCGIYNDDGDLYLFFTIGINDIYVMDCRSVETINTDTWYHVACVKEGNNYYLFLDGVLVDSDVYSTGWANISGEFRIGSWHLYSILEGWIDEFRISKGIARWTSNFTPPTEAYSALEQPYWFFGT